MNVELQHQMLQFIQNSTVEAAYDCIIQIAVTSKVPPLNQHWHMEWHMYSIQSFLGHPGPLGRCTAVHIYSMMAMLLKETLMVQQGSGPERTCALLPLACTLCLASLA